jgi:hypothetical protein
MTTQKEFDKVVSKFNRMEDTRDSIWIRAEKLLRGGHEIDADLLILATWNFARFRYAMKEFDLKGFENIIGELELNFNKLRNEQFASIDFDIHKKDISFIYDKLAEKKGIEFTGATKIMALKNSNLFVMWDTAIRKMYNKKLVRGKKIPQRPSGLNYVDFLIYLRQEFMGVKISDKNKSLAKAIDEYNYVKAEKYR